MRSITFAACCAVSAVVASASLNFMVLGDWGGLGVDPFHTPGQAAAAKSMQKTAASIQSEFVLALGDNFYFQGIESDETSKRFQDTFESVYSGENLQVPWYVIAGNHDYIGNVSAEIAYSKHSARWKFPSLYHSHSFVSDDGISVDIILIDTVALTNSESHNLLEGDPDYFKPLPHVTGDQPQWDWLEQQLEASTADYLLVGGHFPVYSVCDHGPTSALVTSLNPLLLKHQAHYMSGHDHCAMHFVDQDVNYIVQGMGDLCCYAASNLNHPSIPSGSVKWYFSKENAGRTSAGYSSMTASVDGLVVTYYDEEGTVKYTSESIPKRAKLN